MVYRINVFIMKKNFSLVVGRPDVKAVVLYEGTPVDFFLSQQVDDNLFAVTNPLIMLLNQKRLASVPDAVLENWFSVGALPDNYRDKLTDEQRFDLIKSRYIQSPADLKTYIDYLDNTILSEKSKLEAAAYAKKLEDSRIAQQKAAAQSASTVGSINVPASGSE